MNLERFNLENKKINKLGLLVSKLRRKFKEAAKVAKEKSEASEKSQKSKIQNILNKQRRDN